MYNSAAVSAHHSRAFTLGEKTSSSEPNACTRVSKLFIDHFVFQFCLILRKKSGTLLKSYQWDFFLVRTKKTTSKSKKSWKIKAGKCDTDNILSYFHVQRRENMDLTFYLQYGLMA